MSTYTNAGSSSRATPAWAQNGYQDDMEGTDEEDNVFRDMSFEDILEELIARFMVNLPREETTPVRLYWQAEQAHWFYDDYLRPLNPSLPPLSQKHFTKVIIASSPLYANIVDEDGRPINYDLTWEKYTRYKKMVPTCGVILINAKESKTLLVRHYGAKAWSWPRGKINENETEDDCAVRELEEETGYDCSRRIDPTAKCEAFINGQSSTMFFVTGVDESFPFAAQTRNEIEETRWVKLQELPTWSRKRPKSAEKPLVFFKVAPFVHALKHYLHSPNRHDRARSSNLQAAVRNDASVLPSTISVHSIPSVSSHPITEPVTALDKLFANFVHGQEADLQRGGSGGNEDNRDGLERLFGNLSVSASEQARKEEKEDDALARLLGAIGTSPTPAPAQQPRLEPGKSSLLSMLNQKTPSAPPRSPRQASPQQHDSQTPKPHAANLLAMLAPPAQVQAKAQQSAPTQTQHVSLTTTPRPPSPPADDRITKQRALLDMTLAGLGLDPTPVGQASHIQPTYIGIDHGISTQNNTYHDPPRITPPQTSSQQQYRPPAPPAPFPPPSGAYYTSNPAQQAQHHYTSPSYPNGPGLSPPRNRGVPPPPYESHYGAPYPVRPMPPVVPAQPVHDYNSHTQGYYARSQPPIPAQGQTYRPHLPPQSSQQQQQQQQPFSSGFQQPHTSLNTYHPSYGVSTGYQAASQRPPLHPGPGQYQAQHIQPQQQQQQQPYIPSVQGHPPNNGVQTHHTGPMHQPVPKGPQSSLLAMLNK